MVIEDAAEVIAIGKNFILRGQEGAARIDQIDARQMILLRDLLGAQMLLHRHRIIRAALDGRVVGDDHAFAARDTADAGDDARSRHLIAVHAVSGHRRQLQHRRAGIDQRIDTVAGEELAAGEMLLPRFLAPAARHQSASFAQVRHQSTHSFRVVAKLFAAHVELGINHCHFSPP